MREMSIHGLRHSEILYQSVVVAPKYTSFDLFLGSQPDQGGEGPLQWVTLLSSMCQIMAFHIQGLSQVQATAGSRMPSAASTIACPLIPTSSPIPGGASTIQTPCRHAVFTLRRPEIMLYLIALA